MRWLAAVVVLLCASPAHACKPAPWLYGDNSPKSFAARAFENTAAIVLAKILEVSTDPATNDAQVTHARVQLVEQFKGPALGSTIHRVVSHVTCVEQPWKEGEQRLFLLTYIAEPYYKEAGYYELHAWRLNHVPADEVLIPELRKLRNAKKAP